MQVQSHSTLEIVESRVVPRQEDRDKMNRLSERLRHEVANILRSNGITADVSIQGSVARDTWLRGEADLDIFARLSTEMDRTQWNERVLPALRKGLRRYPLVERYAEHPYLEFSVGSIKVNVVPCYNVEKGNWKSATDRTPFHTHYMLQHLTPDLRMQARLLKKFTRGIGVYGAEIRVGGFSGMLVETLTLNYRSFNNALGEASRWNNRTVIEIEPSGRANEELGQRFDSSLVVVDPVDPNRNLAAAVREDRLWEFVAAAREFLVKPSLVYFYPQRLRSATKAQLLDRLKKLNHSIVVITFPHGRMVPDILWAQLFSLERAMVNLAKRHEFHVLHSNVWSDEDRSSTLILEVESATLSSSQLHPGPPVARKDESEAFLNRHAGASDTVKGPWLSGDRWMVEKERAFSSLADLLVAAARNRNLGLAVPMQLEEGFRKKVRVLVNEQILSLHSQAGFAGSLRKFLDGRPSWMRNRRT